MKFGINSTVEIIPLRCSGIAQCPTTLISPQNDNGPPVLHVPTSPAIVIDSEEVAWSNTGLPLRGGLGVICSTLLVSVVHVSGQMKQFQ